jgi:hypothetical protein
VSREKFWWQVPSLVKHQRRAPWGSLSGFLVAVTTRVGDVDGGPPGGCYQQVQQRSPPKLKTSMVGPLGVLSAGPAAATTVVEDVGAGPLGVLAAGPAAATTEDGDVDGGPPWGLLVAGLAATTTDVEDVDGGPPGGAGGRSGSGHHRSWRRRWRAPGGASGRSDSGHHRSWRRGW